MSIEIDWDKLAALGAASLGGGFGSLIFWAYRVMSRKLRRPYLFSLVYFSLGLVASVGVVSAVEMTNWHCHISAKVSLGILTGCVIGNWGPSVLLILVVRLALEVELYLDARRKLKQTLKDDDLLWREEKDETGSD